MKLGSSQQILVKYSHVKFHKNPSSESRVIPRVRTDRLDEDKSRYSQNFEILLEFQSFSKFRKTLKVTSKYSTTLLCLMGRTLLQKSIRFTSKDRDKQHDFVINHQTGINTAL
jgi:hypothetical protein